MKGLLLAVVMLVAGAATAYADPPPMSVNEATVRWLPGDLPMAGYFRITSHAAKPVYLVGATSPAFGTVMLHRSVEESGVSRMEPVERVTLNPKQTVTFAPGGFHLMFVQHRQEVHVGEEVAVTLQFSDGATLTTPFTVVGVQGK
jgi:copper(I)-binding protein